MNLLLCFGLVWHFVALHDVLANSSGPSHLPNLATGANQAQHTFVENAQITLQHSASFLTCACFACTLKELLSLFIVQTGMVFSVIEMIQRASIPSKPKCCQIQRTSK